MVSNKYTTLDYLFIGAHPDDIEIFAGGFLLKLLQQKFKVGILDLTRGELGTYGSIEKRAQEIAAANAVMGLHFRSTLSFKDGSLVDSEEVKTAIVSCIRGCQAKIVVTFPALCRHPDHYAAHKAVKAATFLAGVKKYAVGNANSEARLLEAFRPMAMLSWVEFIPLPQISFVVDITEQFPKKERLVECYDSQVMKKSNYIEAVKNETLAAASETFIGSSAFWDSFLGKAQWFGSQIGVRYGEAYYSSSVMHLENPLENFSRKHR